MIDTTPSFAIYISKLTHYSSIKNLFNTMSFWTLTLCFTHIWSYTTPNKSSDLAQGFIINTI
jgi:hypothetical protein